jgi:hypothetical protein
MRAVEYFLNLCAVLVVGFLRVSKASTEFHICAADDPLFLGTYTAGKQVMDGVPIFSNANDMSFFRNKGFWYVGNLAPWPPETHYRCVEAEGCNYGANFPPTSAEGAWKPAKKYDKGNLPVISTEPCVQANEEL